MFNDICPSHHYKVLTYGRATAEFHTSYGPVVAHASAEVESAIELIDMYDCSEDITFVCGRRSLRSVHGHADMQHVSQYECIVYDQEIRGDLRSDSYDLAIITSPLNFESFAKAKRKASTYLSIGETTAAALQKQGIKSLVAAHPSEAGIAITLGKWLAR